jgi:hypothetical protein
MPMFFGRPRPLHRPHSNNPNVDVLASTFNTVFKLAAFGIVAWMAFIAGVIGTLLYFGYKALTHYGVI